MNLLLVSLDSLRKDRVGCYNQKEGEGLTPQINELGEQGVIFNQNFTVMGATIPSHCSILTGCYPITHGIRKNGWKLKDNVMMLAEVLKKEGYATLGAVGVETLSSLYGFNKGFDVFFDNSKFDKLTYYLSKIGWKRYNLSKLMQHFGIFDTHSRNCHQVNKDILEWLDKNHEKKFFMFLHYFDIHGDTFGGKRRLREKVEHYNENVKIVDHGLKQIIDKLKERGILKDTLIILMADHGETLDTNKKLGHGQEINEEELNIPLIMYKQDLLPAKKVNILTRTIDIMPTIMEILKVPVYFKMDGVSLIETIFEDKELAREIFIETYPGFCDIKGIRTKKWLYTLKDNENERLYEVVYEKGEKGEKEEKFRLKEKAIEENKEIALRSRVRVKKHFGIKYKEQEVDEYTHQMLKKLGYA